MKHYTGYYFCFASNWDNENYDAANLVSIERNTEDFNNLINTVKNHEVYKDVHEAFDAWRRFNEPKPEVFDWLVANVKDEKSGVKGWCCGNKEYNTDSHEGFSLFFYRRKDALNFIKTWSVHKKPTETYNQNTYVNKILDTKTNTLKILKK